MSLNPAETFLSSQQMVESETPFSPPGTVNVGGLAPVVLHRLGAQAENFIRVCVRVLVQLCGLFGFETAGYHTLGTELHWIYCASLEGDAMKFVKYKLAAYYSAKKSTSSCPQEVKEYKAIEHGFDYAHVLLGGRAYRWLRQLERYQRVKFDQLLFSILQSKKGMPRPTDLMLRQAEQDAFVKLTTATVMSPPEELVPKWSDMADYPDNVETTLSEYTFKQQLRRTVNEVFEGVVYTPDDRIRPFFPSTSANYINSRDNGGAVSVIKEHADLLKGLEESDDLVEVWEDNGIPRCDYEKLNIRFERLYWKMLSAAAVETPHAIPLALPEALKTRVITKGPPLLNTVLKPLQRKLHNVLRNHPFFKLVGQPIDAVYVQDRVGAKLGADQSYLSGDWRDASNSVKSWVSRTTGEAISDILSLLDDERELLRKGLVSHVLVNPETGVELEQQSGQLMGSIVSFPVLCLINATIIRWAHEIVVKRQVPLDRVPGCANGDDGLLKTTTFGKHLWERISLFAGLETSVGKVYFSRSFLNMNSEEYTFHPEGYETRYFERKSGEPYTRLIHFQHCPYVNLGLLFGLKRSGGNVAEGNQDATFSERAHELLRLGPSDMKDTLLSTFINRNRVELTKYPTNWFLPESLGGKGLPITNQHKPDRNSLCIARKVAEHPAMFAMPSRPAMNSWKVWDYSGERLKSSLKRKIVPSAVTSLTPGYALSEDDVRGKFCVEALFRWPLKRLKVALNSSVTDRIDRLRYKVFRRALRDKTIPYPEPLNLDNYISPPTTNSIPYIFDQSKTIGLADLMSDVEPRELHSASSGISLSYVSSEAALPRLLTVEDIPTKKHDNIGWRNIRIYGRTHTHIGL
jgi:hypothetical protein